MIDETPEAWGALTPAHVRCCWERIMDFEPSPMPPDFRLIAVIGTWQEEDIIEACVRNCFRQGADEVLVVDNASDDRTCELAREAGAFVAHVYRTDYYDEAERMFLMNCVAAEAVERKPASAAWVLMLDADEFIQGIGCRLKTWLANAGKYDTIGAIAFDHYPTGHPANIPGFHPGEFQSHGMLREGFVVETQVDRAAWKMPLLHYRARQPYDLCQTRGMHGCWASKKDGQPQTIRIPKTHLLIHHFMFREEKATRRRLEKLCGPRPQFGGRHRSAGDDEAIDGEGAVKRWRSLEAVYSQRWEDVELCHSTGTKSDVVTVRPWQELVGPSLYAWERWYSLRSLRDAVATQAVGATP